jgi:saccharopine dehydrogenase-like NADP-dependent oxidoreductase
VVLDITDEQELRKAIRQVDVVMNSAGPFFRFGVPVLIAAIDEGKHYSDICDDWQPTVEMLKLSERAKQAGVTAVIGLGASPGIVNLLCVKAATALDKADTIVSAWKLSGAVNEDDGFTAPPTEGHVDAAAVHLMHCLSEKIRVLRNGRAEETAPLEHSQIDFPTLGALDVWSLGHPEAVTLVRRFPELQNSYNGMLGIEDIVDDLRQVADAVAAGQMSVDDAARMLASDGGREARQERLAKKEREDVPGALAYAAGQKDGKPATAGAYIKNRPAGGMATITGIPHALFLPMLHRGQLQKTGVFAPEEVVNPDIFFELLDPFCGPDGTGLTVLTSN